MTSGAVRGRAAFYSVHIRGPMGEEAFETVVDTGFSGFLTLSLTSIERLGLMLRGVRPSTMADGRRVLLNTYSATVFWQDKWVDAIVLETKSVPLLGMSLLFGCNLNVDVIGGGQVNVTALE